MLYLCLSFLFVCFFILIKDSLRLVIILFFLQFDPPISTNMTDVYNKSSQEGFFLLNIASLKIHHLTIDK